jgi:hypothetical protein
MARRLLHRDPNWCQGVGAIEVRLSSRKIIDPRDSFSGRTIVDVRRRQLRPIALEGLSVESCNPVKASAVAGRSADRCGRTASSNLTLK